MELFGGNPFPPVGEHPYLLTLGPHSFYWFALSGSSTSVGGHVVHPGRGRLYSPADDRRLGRAFQAAQHGRPGGGAARLHEGTALVRQQGS